MTRIGSFNTLIVSRWIVALGAVITIIASLTGFLLQQLMIFEDCLQRDPSASVRISKTNNCRVPNIGALNLDSDPVPSMVAAINAGMVQSVPDHTKAVSHGCLSGNCAFPSDLDASFSTVAVGYRCFQIKDRIIRRSGPNNATIFSLPIETNKTIEICPNCASPKAVMGTGAGVTSHFDSRTLATI